MLTSRYNLSSTVIMRRRTQQLRSEQGQGAEEVEITVQNRLLGETNTTDPAAGLSLNSSIVHNYYATSSFGLGSASPRRPTAPHQCWHLLPHPRTPPPPLRLAVRPLPFCTIVCGGASGRLRMVTRPVCCRHLLQPEQERHDRCVVVPDCNSGHRLVLAGWSW